MRGKLDGRTDTHEDMDGRCLSLWSLLKKRFLGVRELIISGS